MNRIYYDCEFLEGTQTRRILGIPFGKTKPTIDLISIGMVRDDGQEYYAISKDFNLKEAWNRYDIETEKVHGDMRNVFPEGREIKVYWIRENVLKPIWRELIIKSEDEWFAYASEGEYQDFLKEVNSGDCDYKFTYKSLKKLIHKFGKSNKQIAAEVEEFCRKKINSLDYMLGKREEVYHNEPIELYGYYSSYDHCALCWLFGKMIDLPSGFPMYTKDLKQILDDKANFIANKVCYESGNHTVWSIKEAIGFIKKDPAYPKQQNEHSAIHDARWNKQLHEFLKQI